MPRSFSLMQLLLLCLVMSAQSITSESTKVQRSLRYYSFEYHPGDDDYYKQLEKKAEEEKRNSYANMTFTEKVHKMEQNAKSEFYTIGTTSPGQWTGSEWSFFFLLVGFCCAATFLLYGAIFGLRRRIATEEQEFGYQNMMDARGNRMEFPLRPARTGDSDDDTIMRARSID